MTWQLGSVLVLTFALAVSFAWYERSRPPARVLALVAALAALAAIGRVAFAAFPNVKPTTDIVLFSGYALGGPAGFAVGAIAALVSNVFLGQGPWTPWQMAAWGIVGLGGAAFGKLAGGREPNRFVLAVVCGLAGFVFGGLMDLYQWTLAAEHTLSSYIAVSGTSLTFNIAHAVGNVVFALLLGPVFIRSLARYRRRFEVRWLRTAPAGGAVAAALIGMAVMYPASASAAAEPPADVAPAIGRAVHYLRFSQNPDGGFGAARKQSSTQLHTGWTALGLAAAGSNPRDVAQRGRSIADFVKARANELDDIGELERTMLVLRSAGLPQRLDGRNLLTALIRKQRSSGAWDTLNHTAFGVLALRAAGKSAGAAQVRRAVAYLIKAQNKDGGYGFARSAASDVDDTAAVMQALAAGGRRSSRTAKRAISYLRKAQRPDGGFAQMQSGDSNAQSTAFAIQGLIAVGRNPRKFRRTRTPIEYLKSLQASDGSFRYSRTSSQTPVWVTAQALVALEGVPYPVPPAPRKKARAAGDQSPAASPASTAEPSAGGATAASAAPKAAATAASAAPKAVPTGESEIRVRPAAATTTTASAPSNDTSSANGGKGSYRPFIFAVILGVVMLIGIRAAWRRG